MQKTFWEMIKMSKFSSLSWYAKLSIIAGVLTSIGTIAAFTGLSIPRVVWADDFQQFQKEYYIDKLDMVKKDLRQVKMQEYRLQQTSQPIPEFIIEEKMELEDTVKTLEKKVDKIEQAEHALDE